MPISALTRLLVRANADDTAAAAIADLDRPALEAFGLAPEEIEALREPTLQGLEDLGIDPNLVFTAIYLRDPAWGEQWSSAEYFEGGAEHG